MYKNIAISLLGAWVLRDVFGTTEVREQIAIVMGLAAMLFIFLLFCGENRASSNRFYPAGKGRCIFAAMPCFLLVSKWP